MSHASMQFCYFRAIFLAGWVVAGGFPVSLPAQESPPFIRQFCLDCHGSENPERGFGLDHFTWQPDVAGNFEKWVKVYDHVETLKMPPADASQPAAAERNAFLVLLRAGLLKWNQQQQEKSGRVTLRRLNRTEYENTLHDLLGIDTPLKQILPEDTPLDGFDTVADGLRLSPLHIEKYLEAADTALDAAIRLGHAPEPIKKRILIRELEGVRKNLEEPKSILREVDGSVVLFADASYIVTLRGFHLEHAGRYRMKLRGQAFQSEKPVVLSMYAGDYGSGTKKLLAFFDMPPDQPREVEFVARLEKNGYLYPAPADLTADEKGQSVWSTGGKPYGGSGLALEWFEIEGPLYDQWPSPQLRTLFGDLTMVPVKSQEKNRWAKMAYDVETKDPPADAARILTSFATRAFRRPLADDEISGIVELVHSELKDGRPFVDAIRTGLRAILTSPEFLLMPEQPGKLDDFALASRLSYFLWSSLPDDELLRLAVERKLSQPEVLRAQTERMLADPRSQRFVSNFTGQWLDLRNIDATSPDMRLYPEFDELLKFSMVRETEAFMQELLTSDLPVTNLVDSPFAMLNRRLAEHYRIPNVAGEEIRRVELPAESHRGGVLTQAAVLKVTANGTMSSPVMRGAWVMKRILGQPPPPPPPNVSAIEPDTRGATTIREQLAKHRDSADCAGCHQLIDPAGFALENYDVIGGWRERYRTQGKGDQPEEKLHGRRIHEYRLGAAVDASAELPDGRAFRDLDELKKLLLDRPAPLVRNVAERLVVYGTGASLQFADRPALDKMVRHAAEKQNGFRTLIHEVVQSPVFQRK